MLDKLSRCFFPLFPGVSPKVEMGGFCWEILFYNLLSTGERGGCCMWAELRIARMCGFIKALGNPGYVVSERKGNLEAVLLGWLFVDYLFFFHMCHQKQ